MGFSGPQENFKHCHKGGASRSTGLSPTGVIQALFAGKNFQIRRSSKRHDSPAIRGWNVVWNLEGFIPPAGRQSEELERTSLSGCPGTETGEGKSDKGRQMKNRKSSPLTGGSGRTSWS